MSQAAVTRVCMSPISSKKTDGMVRGVAPAFHPGHQHFAVGSGPQVYLASSPEGSNDSVQVVFLGHLDQLRVYQRFTLHAFLLNVVEPEQDLPASLDKGSE